MRRAKVTVEELTARFVQVAGHATIPDGWTPVGAWIRVSGDKQDETNQVEEVINYCVQHKYWIVCWYIVHAKSAFKGEHQKDLDIAVEDMREGRTEVLVIAHSNRLERRENREDKPDIGTELLATLAEFVDAGGRVESVEEPTLGQVDIGSRALTYMTGLMNTEKSKTIRRETKRAYDVIDANHGVRNKVPGVWYTIKGEKKNKHPVPTQLCRDYWPEVLKRCIAGDSAATIAGWLDSEGVRTKRGGKWNQGTVLHLIHNPIFCGRRLGWEDDAPLLKSEAVVPVDLWQKAVDALATRPKRGQIAKTNRPMLAKLKCPRCGSPMYRKMIGGPRSRRFAYRCEGQGPQRKGCGNLVEYERLEMRVVVNMLTRNDKPYQIRDWVPGTNWDAEIADAIQTLQTLNPVKIGIPEYNRRHAELMTQLADLQWKNENEATAGGWEYTDVLNDDGSVMTEGQHFFGLDRDGRRDYLKTHDIGAERVATGDGIRLVIDGEDDIPNPQLMALINIAGPEVTRIMMEAQIPNAIELGYLLRGELIPGAEIYLPESLRKQDPPTRRHTA
jgi:DNA invertase Pin-like site-specific DNA recombinase